MAAFFKLRHLFRGVTSLSLTVALAPASCGGAVTATPNPPAGPTSTDAGIDPSVFDFNVCDAGMYEALVGVTPSTPIDFLELREVSQFGGGGSGTRNVSVAATSGTKCKTATNVAACEAALEALAPSPGWQRLYEGHRSPPYRHAVFTRGDEVATIPSLDALAAFLAPVDGIKDAALLLSERTHRFNCAENNARITPAGIELITLTGHGCGAGRDIYENLVRVAADGTIVVTRTVRIEEGNPQCAIGRRPEGFAATRSDARAPLGAYFAEMAQLEAASVFAFERLVAELRAHGAPAELIAAATDAARDEVRHTKTTIKLAERFGGRACPPRIEERSPTRALVDIAIENAAEGCVRETFGALAATFQSAHAGDEHIARALRVIAEDETRHAALAWDVDAWILPRLDRAERARVEHARRAAIRNLARDLRAPIDAELATQAGVPSAESAAWLLAQVHDELWGGPAAA